jgi:Asp-tRNA(Asn)/Glu-tRNA(Gln) amidotransferase A subunit family amidase
VRNPVNPDFIAGGSSGGSAAAVATGMCFAAIGTDTAGSIREPAALCGVVGLKPTYGLVSTHGIIPLSTSLDHAGPITRTVEDAAIVLDAITETPASYRESLSAGNKKFRLGIPRRYFFEGADPRILAAVERAINLLESEGCIVQELDLPVEEDRTVFLAESHAYHRDKIASAPELYDPETLRRVRNGADISERDYKREQENIQKLRRDIVERISDVDVFITPTTPVPAPLISDLTKDIAQLRPAEIVLLRNTRPINAWGLPAISVPCGFTSDGRPIGLQIVGSAGGEAKLLQVARMYEGAGT